ncbi:S1 RNA-binding domain-containing protein [Clostridium sp.]|uniref:S1 RNA-binding domain-containing protein n=1 Tax=Clostridium sp. TaxID=1506 RepID=UPI003464D79B
MINIGQFNRLKVVRMAEFGYYLNGDTDSTRDDILLPSRSTLGRELNVGDEVEAFIYRDSKDRLIATLKTPLATVGELAYLKVVSTGDFGAFVDFGLERDILVPFKEQRYTLEEGYKYLLYVYVDKSGRLAATTDIEYRLEENNDYSIGEETYGIVYEVQKSGSLLVAVEGKYKGIVLKSEYYNYVHIGEELKLTVKKFYEDERIGLTTRGRKLEERDKIQERILNYLKENGGHMEFNDKSSAEDIRRTFNTSKNYFKIALGGLMKKKLITQDENGTTLKKEEVLK